MIKGIKSLSRLVDKLSGQPGPGQSTIENNSSSNELSLIRKPPKSPRDQSPNRPIALISPTGTDTVQHIATVRVNSPRRSQGQAGNQRIQNSSNSSQVQHGSNMVSNNSFNNLNVSEQRIRIQNTSFLGDISLIRGPNRQMPLQSNIPNHSTPYQQRPYVMRQINQPMYNPPTNQPLNSSMPVRYVIRPVDQIGNQSSQSQQFNQIPRPNIPNSQLNGPPQYNQLFGSSFSSQASTPSPAQINQPRMRMTRPQYHIDQFRPLQPRQFQPMVPERALRPNMNSYLNNNMPPEVQGNTRSSQDAERQVIETRKKWRDGEMRPLVEFR